MDLHRISALLEPFLDRVLGDDQLNQILMYIDLLLRWNARINLTAIRDPEEIVTRHFGESFFMARHLFPMERRAPFNAGQRLETDSSLGKMTDNSLALQRREGSSIGESSPGGTFDNSPALQRREKPPIERSPGGTTDTPFPREPHGLPRTRVIDLGSGAGFPALPIKIWAPDIHLVLIESNHKKVTFLREVARALTLTNVNVIAERAEVVSARLGPEFPPADLVTFRAVEKFDKVLPLAATFLSPQSRLALLISEPQLCQLTTLLPALNCQTIHIPKSHSRVLTICVPQ